VPSQPEMDEVFADEAGPAGDQNARHAQDSEKVGLVLQRQGNPPAIAGGEVCRDQDLEGL
jgi:hypothetical protein